MAKLTENPTYFRQDIQGLRAIAVLLVVIYHTGIAFPGGYIGVDMFFVISGFVITQLISREYERTNKFGLADFYSRRIGRILPAVALATVGTLLISVVALSPFGEQQQVIDTSRASSLFATNFYFFLQDSYWALAENPLRHLWSLAVEEQFYLIFPILLILLNVTGAKMTSSSVRVWLIAISIVSFSGSYYLSLGNQFVPKSELFAFFGTPWRMWEFLVGAVVALTPGLLNRLSKVGVHLVNLFAITIIFWAAISFDSFTLFPGSAALAPVFGTAILIQLGARTSITTRILGFKALTKIGTISYSWYLWHWPLIVFAHRLFPNSQKIAPVLAALIAAGIAIISLNFVENPIRQNPKIRGTQALKLGVICTIAPILVSVAVQVGASTGLGLQVIRNVEIEQSSFADINQCRIHKWMNTGPDCDGLIHGPDAKRVLLIGDSSASSISDGVAAAANALGLNFSVYYSYHCPIFIRPVSLRTACRYNFDKVLKKVSDLNPDILVISNMSEIYIDGVTQGDEIQNSSGTRAKDTGEAIQFWLAGLSDKIEKDFKSQKTLVILQPPTSKMRELVLLRKIFDDKVSLSHSTNRNRVTGEESELYKKYSNFAVLDPANTLCVKFECQQSMNGEALYYDALHLTVKGSLLLKDAIASELELLLAKS